MVDFSRSQPEHAPRAGAGPRSERKSEPWDDVPELLRLRDAVAAADPAAPPGTVLASGHVAAGERIALLAGSFNPPHVAHLVLARAALSAARLDRLVLVISKRTVDKERVEGLDLADRLLLLGLLAEEDSRLAVALVNRGLYVDQVAAVQATWPDLAELWFVVGHDKIVQIFDPRYYADRDSALVALFGRARFLVAPRAGASAADLQALLARPENRRFSEAVRPIGMPAELAGTSSSDLRRLMSGERSVATRGPAVAELPELARRVIASTGAYAPPIVLPGGEAVDRYALRLALLDALASARAWAEAEADLAGLVEVAAAPTELGAKLRAWLRQGISPATSADVAGTLAACQEAAWHRPGG